MIIFINNFINKCDHIVNDYHNLIMKYSEFKVK